MDDNNDNNDNTSIKINSNDDNPNPNRYCRLARAVKIVIVIECLRSFYKPFCKAFFSNFVLYSVM